MGDSNGFEEFAPVFVESTFCITIYVDFIVHRSGFRTYWNCAAIYLEEQKH